MAKVTVYDVAKEAGVSPATVSRVINRKGYIAPQTLRRVERAMSKLGYLRPFAAVPVSANSGSRAIGVLVPDIRYEHCTNIFYHIENVMSQEGYSCILCNANNSYEKALRDLSVLTHRKVEGLIFVNSFFSSPLILEWLRKNNLSIPIVSALCHLDLPNVYNILLDMDRGSSLVIHQFALQGKNRLALIQSKIDPGSVWLKDSFAKISQGKFSVPPVTVSLPEITINSGYQIAEQLFHEHPQINGLIFDSTLPAIGACRYLLDAGVSVPAEVALCAADMLSIGTAIRPRLACIDNHQDLIGREAARTILDVFAGFDRPHVLQVSVDILKRDTM